MNVCVICVHVCTFPCVCVASHIYASMHSCVFVHMKAQDSCQESYPRWLPTLLMERWHLSMGPRACQYCADAGLTWLGRLLAWLLICLAHRSPAGLTLPLLPHLQLSTSVNPLHIDLHITFLRCLPECILLSSVVPLYVFLSLSPHLTRRWVCICVAPPVLVFHPTLTLRPEDGDTSSVCWKERT